MKVRFKHRVEYILLRGLSGLFCLLPYRMAQAVGVGMAGFAFYVLRFRVSEAKRRIRLVLGDEVDATRIAWISLRNLFLNAVDILRFPKIDKDWVEQYVETSSLDVFRSQWNPEKGAILAVPHMGNWDLAGVGAHLMGLPVFFLARRQKNPLVDDLLNRMRGVTGVETVLTDSTALRQVVRNLKAGKIFAMLPDVRAREASIQVHFLGGTADLATGMESFARHGDVPIFPAYAIREGWSRHRWVALDPVRADHTLSREEDRQRIMQTVMSLFDDAIRRMPEQYFWYNKRWILDPLKQNPLS